LKINLTLIAVGVLFIFAAYMLHNLEIPWITFTPLPTVTTVNPFEPIVYLLAAVGFIAIIFGLTENPILRFTFALLTLLVIFAIFQGWFDVLLDIIRRIRIV